MFDNLGNRSYEENNILNKGGDINPPLNKENVVDLTKEFVIEARDGGYAMTYHKTPLPSSDNMFGSKEGDSKTSSETSFLEENCQVKRNWESISQRFFSSKMPFK